MGSSVYLALSAMVLYSNRAVMSSKMQPATGFFSDLPCDQIQGIGYHGRAD